MSDNSVRTPGLGETIRSIDKSGIKSQVFILDVGGAGAENLLVFGAKAAASSIPVTLSTEDTAKLGTLTDAPSGALESATSRSIVSLLKNISNWLYQLVNPPTRISYTAAITASQTGTAVWTPTSGKTFSITHITFIAGAAGAGALTVFDGTDASGNHVLKGTFANNGGCDKDFASMPWKSAAPNNVLKWTTGAGCAGDLTVDGFEV